MKLSQVLLLCLLGLIVFSCIITQAVCQEEGDEIASAVDDEVPIELQQPVAGEETLSGFVSSNDIVGSSILLTKNSLALGEPVEVLVGLKNIAQDKDTLFNIQYARGYVISLEQNFIIQNLTGLAYNITIAPTQSASLLYSFVASPQLEAREYTVAVEVFYIGSNKDTYGTVAFNQTLSFVQKEESLFTIGSIFQLTTVAGMIGLVFVGVFQVMSGRTKKRGGSTTTSTGDQVSEDKLVRVGKEKVNTEFIPTSHKKLVEKLQKKKSE